MIIPIILLISSPLPAIPLEFAVPAMQAGICQLERWEPLVEYLEAYSGSTIHLNIVKDHRSLYEGLAGRYYDIGFMNAYWTERAGSMTELTLAARSVIEEEDSLITAIIVHRDSIIREISQLGGEYLALTIPKESLCGYFVPLQLFARQNIEPSKRFDQIVYAGNYQSILKGVAFGVIDAGAVTLHTLDSPDNSAYRQQVRIIARSERIPSWSVVTQTDKRTSEIDTLIRGLLDLSESTEGRELLERTGFSGFLPPSEIETPLDPEIMTFIEAHHAPAE